ncbi:Pro-Pol polyprotein [Araneus ventricosus]|uniref:Pro-Pol polyprotein n=1 Tax=Araneus ventricosus TaxID=182803 RepID=A0A4Y2ALN2_ARAVE|nr:Pro-Pol polyprotein [Araneus ventricosus]
MPKLQQKIEQYIANCVPCILINRKRGKQEDQLAPISKPDTSLSCYHIDHLGPLDSNNKNYKHILCIIDVFTKFVWIYQTKSTTSAEVVAKLEIQKSVFGNPEKIISDRGTAFSSKELSDYCENEGIRHLRITTGLPRANGQVERLNSVIISVIAKLATNDPTKWYKFVPTAQKIINSTYQRSINTTPFELLFGIKMKQQSDLKIMQLIQQQIQDDFVQARDFSREKSKLHIQKAQESNRKNYNLRRRSPNKYNVNDMVVIKRTQYGPGLKLRAKYLGPYKITKVKLNNTYDVEKVNSVSCGPEVRTTSGSSRCGKVNPRLTQLPPSNITRELMSLSANENEQK